MAENASVSRLRASSCRRRIAVTWTRGNKVRQRSHKMKTRGKFQREITNCRGRTLSPAAWNSSIAASLVTSSGTSRSCVSFTLAISCSMRCFLAKKGGGGGRRMRPGGGKGVETTRQTEDRLGEKKGEGQGLARLMGGALLCRDPCGSGFIDMTPLA